MDVIGNCRLQSFSEEPVQTRPKSSFSSTCRADLKSRKLIGWKEKSAWVLKQTATSPIYCLTCLSTCSREKPFLLSLRIKRFHATWVNAIYNPQSCTAHKTGGLQFIEQTVKMLASHHLTFRWVTLERFVNLTQLPTAQHTVHTLGLNQNEIHVHRNKAHQSGTRVRSLFRLLFVQLFSKHILYAS